MNRIVYPANRMAFYNSKPSSQSCVFALKSCAIKLQLQLLIKKSAITNTNTIMFFLFFSTITIKLQLQLPS